MINKITILSQCTQKVIIVLKSVWFSIYFFIFATVLLTAIPKSDENYLSLIINVKILSTSRITIS